MPFKDKEKNREYQRDYKRQQRAGSRFDSESNPFESSIRIKTAKDILELLERTINQVNNYETDMLIKARCIGYLAGITLKTVETANLESRLESLETTLKLRKVK